MIAPPFAILADGAVVPLQNCRACGEMGRADMAHYHVCRPSESECATLRAEVERLRAREGGVDNLDAQIVELRTEVERLRAELALESELATLHAGGASRAESRLSAATELLERTSKVAHEDDLDARIALVDAVDAFLAAQPAAPACECSGDELWECPVPGCPAKKRYGADQSQVPLAAAYGVERDNGRPRLCGACEDGRPDDCSGWCGVRPVAPPSAPARTEAEQAVLDAMAKAAIAVYTVGTNRFLHAEDEHDVCVAELARREAAK